MALAISKAENSLQTCDRVSKPNKNNSVDVGLFQVNNLAHRNKATIEQLKDCKTNILIAKQIYDASGWNAWSVYKNGSYHNHLTLEKDLSE